MKKLFSLFLSLSFLFLTACNITPPVGTKADGSTLSGSQSGDSTGTSNSNNTNNSNTNNGNTSGSDDYYWDWRETMQDQFVSRFDTEMINLPSRIVFEASIDDGPSLTYYYSKADGNAYVYCYDPLCDHTKYTCLGKPQKAHTGWSFNDTVFVNNRFYLIDNYGKIYSFAFDGTDKKLEYDAGYMAHKSVWGGPIAYGPYIYINSEAEESPHTLRYNVETKKMEDLTEKTGNYIYTHYIYNGIIYGNGDNDILLDGFYKADIDLNTIDPIEEIFIAQHAGSVLVGSVYKERENLSQTREQIGISFYDMKTGERRIVTKEDLGLDYYPVFIAATDEYFYFYRRNSSSYIGTAIFNQSGKEVERQVKKLNDGKIYRMNKDGTNIVCVYDNPQYELNRNVLIYDDKIVMQGRYMTVENKEQKIWGGAIQVATINPDGTIGEFVEVEVLQ